MTLVLPQSDYAALLAATLRGTAAWRSGANATAPLMRGISVFEPYSSAEVTPAASSIQLEAYEGWGVRASWLTVVPEQPLPSGYTLPDWVYVPPASPPTETHDESSERAVAIGVGVGVGGALMVAAAVAGFLLWRRNKRWVGL